MFTWSHRSGYSEDNYEESGLSAEEIVARLMSQNSIYWENDVITLDNPNPSYEPWEFLEQYEIFRTIR